MRTKIYCGLTLIAALLAAGCSESEPFGPAEPFEPIEPGPQPQTETVNLSLSLGAQWDLDVEPSRAAPPGLGGGSNNQSDINSANGDEEIKGVDRVKVVVFRRKEDAADPEFYLDPSNLQDLDLTDGPTDDVHGAHAHRVASGKLTKVYGYEYRVLALAFDSQKGSTFPTVGDKFTLPSIVGDHNRMDLGLKDGLKLSQFNARILTHNIVNNSNNWQDFIGGHTNTLSGVVAINEKCLSMKATEVPQLFFAECQSPSGEVIRFQETGADGTETTTADVTGTLYRGLAKVEVHIRKADAFTYGSAPYNPTWIALMADNVFTSVSLAGYDGFLAPTATIEADKYTPLAYAEVSDEGEAAVLTAYLLPCKTRLALRIKGLGALNAYRLTNAQIFPSDQESQANGTGIISPDSHDGIFYLRRNHKYVITLNSTANIVTNHPINNL